MGNKKTEGDITQIRELIFGEQIRQNQKKFDEIDTRLNALKNTLANFEDETGQSFKKFEKDVQKMENNLESLIQKTRKELSKSLDSTRNDILKKIDQLNLEKTDRMLLGNLLVELGMRIKGEDLMDTLKKGADLNKNE